jgi:hypothetical protein
MAWDFETEPEFQRKLDWANEWVINGWNARFAEHLEHEVGNL